MAQSTDKVQRKTVLMARFSAIGDVAMTIPVIYSACRANPEVHFVMLTRPRMAAMFINAPENLTIEGIDLNEYKGLCGIRRLCRQLIRQYQPNLFLDLHNVLRTKMMRVIVSLHSIPTLHVHKPRAERRKLTRRRNKELIPIKPQAEQYAAVFEAAGLAPQAPFDGLFGQPQTAPSEIFAAITAPKTEGEKWIGVAPFAAHDGKIYPPQKMQLVVKTLAADPSNRIFLFGGGEKEAQILAEWENDHKNVKSLASEQHGFAVELALMNHLDVMLSMDSANMHLAAIVGTPTLSVWGATHPFCGFGPWNQPEQNCIQSTVSCRPCSVFGNKPCFRGDLICLNAISPDRIVNKVKQQIARS